MAENVQGQILKALFDVKEQVGKVAGQVEGIQNAQKETNELIRLSEDTAHRSRAEMREEITKLKDGVVKVEHDVQAVSRRMDSIEAVSNETAAYVADHKAEKQRRLGQLSVARWMGERAWRTVQWVAGVIGFLFITFWREIFAYFRGS